MDHSGVALNQNGGRGSHQGITPASGFLLSVHIKCCRNAAGKPAAFLQLTSSHFVTSVVYQVDGVLLV